MPKIEGVGIKMKLRIILTTEAIIISARTSLDFPAIESRLFEIIMIDAMNEPNMSILSEFWATRYWLPNKMFIAAPGKTNMRIKTGKLTINTHFPSCLLSWLISPCSLFE